jgi:hypothetical protein
MTFAKRHYISGSYMFRADVHGMVRLTAGGVMVVISSKEPAWAYPGPSRGRRLHNKRVHPGPQFLVGSSGQPLLPSAIPPTLSATGHQLPATYHNPVE